MMQMDMNALTQALVLMGQGMLGIFVVILVIFIIVAVLAKATGGGKGGAENKDQG